MEKKTTMDSSQTRKSSPEFDRFASEYVDLLDDPLRNRFAKDPLHFHRRKWLLIEQLLKRIGRKPETLRWLDVGCGQGELLSMAGSRFASAQGCDPSAGMLPSNAVFKTCVQPSPVTLPLQDASVDFVTAVCVYHHVNGSDRKLLTQEIKRVLSPNGLFCVVEHNPWNPVTQAIVKRCPVDADAELLIARETKEILETCGFRRQSTDYFLYFPESLFSSLGKLERMFSKIPLGGQYALLAQAPA